MTADVETVGAPIPEEEKTMPPLSDEEKAALPYQLTDKPATAMDVVDEVTRLSTLIASIMAVSSSSGVVRMINDGTKEPGRSVVIQQARLGMALESWVQQTTREMVLLISEVFEEQADKLAEET